MTHTRRLTLSFLGLTLLAGCPAPAAGPTPGASALPPGASAAPGVAPAPAALTDVALRAGITGGEEEGDFLFVFAAEDGAAGAEERNDDGEVGGGLQVHFDRLALPARLQVFAASDASGEVGAKDVRKPEHLIGTLTVSGLGAGQSTFAPKAGAPVALSNVRAATYFEPLPAKLTYKAALSWRTKSGAAPAGPFDLKIAASGSRDWSSKNTFAWEQKKAIGETFELTFEGLEIPARHLVSVTYTPAGGAAQVTEEIGYLRVHRDYATDMPLVRFDDDGDAKFNLKD